MRSILSVLLVANFILMQVTNHPYIHFFVGLYICFYIIASLPFLKGMSAKITIGLMAMTILLLIGKEKFYILLVEGATTNLSIVCILILTPLLGIPVRVGNYLKSLGYLLSKLKNNVHFTYIIFLGLTHIFSVILNIGSLVINLHLMNSSNVRSKRLIASVLNRGYTTTSSWSPYLAVMTLVVSQLGIEWSKLVLYTIGFVFLSLIIAFLTELKEISAEKNRINSEAVNSTPHVEDVKRNEVFFKMIELFILLSLSMGLVLVVEKNTNLGMVLSISFVSVVFPLVWCTLRGRLPHYKKEVIAHTTKTVPNMQSEFTMFLVAGIFSHVFVQSPLSGKFIHMLNMSFGFSSLLMSIVLSMAIILTGIVGLHPAVMLTIFVTALNPEQIGLTPIYFAALLLGSVGIANTLSSGTAVNNLLANELKIDLFTLSFRWNWLYASILFLVLLLYLQLFII